MKLSGGALTVPIIAPGLARAQQAALPVIGFLSSRSSQQAEHLVAAFLDGLKQTGFVEGQSVTIEYRYADGARISASARSMLSGKALLTRSSNSDEIIELHGAIPENATMIV